MANEDVHVYAAVIQTEITDSATSVAILKSGISRREVAENASGLMTDLTANDISAKYQVYYWTENSQHERPSVIDSNTTQLLIDYCNTEVEKFTLTNSLHQKYTTILLNKFPIRRNSIQEDWKRFYKKYPGTGGIFSLAKIKYYAAGTTAILYYSVRRNGLNGHGAFAIIAKKDGEWQMTYKIYLWWN
jgi:hypothetical protein